jgi:hypothetical protein
MTAIKPLASPITETRLAGIAQLAGGGVLAVVALVVENPIVVIGELLFLGCVFSGLVYPLAYRRHSKRAVRRRNAPPTGDRERTRDTRGRVALMALAAILVLAGLGLLVGSLGLAAGIAVGNGGALLSTSNWLRSWERQHHAQVLRAPRWHWGTVGHRDVRELYVAPLGRTAG